jgi:hypothetical protein
MHMRAFFLAGILVVAGGVTLYAQAASTQAFEVKYLDGSVQVQLKGQATWKSLGTGSLVPADATEKVAKGAAIELSRGTTVISLVKEGTYSMATLLGRVPASGTGLGSSMAAKLHTLTSERPQSSTAGGTRADPCQDYLPFENGGCVDPDAYTAGGSACSLRFVYWGIKAGYLRIVPSGEDFIEEIDTAVDGAVRELLRGHYAKAIDLLRGFNVPSSPQLGDTTTARYLLATAYAETGQPAHAWTLLAGLSVAKEDRAYRDILIRKAQVLVDSFQAQDALVTLQPLLTPLESSEFGQAACLVAYYAYLGLEKPALAADVRRRGIGIDSTSPTAKILAALP